MIFRAVRARAREGGNKWAKLLELSMGMTC